jgi:hypothetical protein
MAKSSTGAACAYTDGITPGIHEEGSGRAGVRGGTAWAKAGRENMAIAHSKAAQHRSERRRNTLPRPRPSPLSSEKMTSGEMIQKVKADRARRRVRYQPEPEPEWTLYGRETGLVVSGGGGAAFVERGQYVLTNGKQAAFLDRTEAGYIDDSGTGYMDSENFRYISHSGIGYIKSKKFRYISG